MKIAIAGYGLEGESNYRYFSADPENVITIADQKQPDRDLPSGISTIIGDDAFERLQDFDLVVRTAGLAPRKIKTNGKIWSATNDFFAKCRCQIIGVTGSKGKGTTVSLIAGILEAAGKTVWLVGNIGKPALEIIGLIKPEDVVVYELSSFQLWDLEYSPHIAVVLYIEQEHLDIHESMSEYVSAKANITKYQSHQDWLVYNNTNQYVKDIANSSVAGLIGYKDITSAHIKEGYFYYGEQKICSINILQIIGKHNIDNACAAIDVAWLFTQNPSVIELGLGSFKGLPHRLQFVIELDGIRYYDDSIATTPNSTIAALNSFNQPVVVILGGSSKGSDFTELGVELAKRDVRAILIGQEAENIENSCLAAGFHDYEILLQPSMSDVVKRAQQISKPGGVVLLSPACASFGMFKNYSDRGEQFTDVVNGL